MKAIRTIKVPQYPDKVMVAKARRAIMYVSAESRVRGRTNIPSSFLTSPHYEFNEDGVLMDVRSGLPKLANPKTAGTPRYWVVNFQDIWNQNITKQDRAMKVDKLKDILRPYIKKIKPITSFPIELNIILYDISMPVDISNKGVVFTKVIEDLLVTEGKIPDDSVFYINCSGSCRYVAVDRLEEKKMEIRILKSER